MKAAQAIIAVEAPESPLLLILGAAALDIYVRVSDGQRSEIEKWGI